MKTEKERKHSYEVLFNAVKGKARDTLHFLDVSKIIEWTVELPPQPVLRLPYMIDKEDWDFLLKLDNGKEPATLLNALKEIAEQLFIYHARLWKQRGRDINIKILSSDMKFQRITYSGSDYYNITITVKVPTAYQASDLILDMIGKVIKNKYGLTFKVKKPLHMLTEKQKEPLKKWFKYQAQILKELRTNRFVNFETTNFITPLVSVGRIESYLKRRVHKEPRLIKCKFCGKQAYVLNPTQEFCFNPSCRVLAARKK